MNFDQGADSQCVFCQIPGRNTAEMLYMSTEWNYFYCYRCRGWFKRHFSDSKSFLPVRSRMEVKRLTWIYTTRMTSVYEVRRLSEGMDDVRRFVGKRLGRA